ncbi:GH25 family lysozyme [Pseudomonas sp. NA-150]|uniref:GH25 family lysozyme n=1 Tax=Pseudomonas sp. NA-150 TaxID=3367525 RepID=UPI0037C88E4D
MNDTVEIPISGTTQVNAVVNVRQGSPRTSAPVLRKLAPGTTVQVFALAAGDAFQGNAHWYRISDSTYIWAGGCGELQTSSQVTSAPMDSQDRAAQLNQVPMVIDMSHGDGVISFADAKNAGLVGVIHKATTGATGKDDAYKSRRDAALSVGLLWGAYHWGTAAPINDQIDNFLGWTGLDQKPDNTTLVALDFESTPGNQMPLADAKAFCTGIQSKLGRRAVIYSGNTLKSGLGSTVDTFFGAHRLWLAQYGSHPTVQSSWTTFWLWQYTDGESGPTSCRSVPGIVGDSRKRLDCDYFAGNAATLAEEWAS